MKNHESLKYLHIVKRAYKAGADRSLTPAKQSPLDTKTNIAQIMSPSAEPRLKLKNTITMYERIKRSLTPIKLPELNKNKSIKSLPPPKIEPELHKDITKVSFKEYGIGNEYAQAFSTTLKDLPNLKELNIRSNRIEDEGAYSILVNLDKTNMKVLDISNNPIGKNSIKALEEMLTNFNSSIEKLSVENTRLSLQSFIQLTNALKSNNSLKELNLANNKLGAGSGFYLKELLSQTISLKKIDLHWNLIRGNEAVLFFEGLQQNDSLTAVDISWNSFGSDFATIEALCNFLSNESQLIHLDISHNRLSFESSFAIGKALENNHSLLGLHIEGNNCRLDHLGFLIPMSEIAVPAALQKSARILRTPRRINDTLCWICNKYLDFPVKWNPESIIWSKKLRTIYAFREFKAREPVYIHLEIDDYNPFLLDSFKEGAFECKRAVPQGRVIKFFFSYRGFAQVSFDYQSEALETPIKKVVKYGEGLFKEISAKAVNFVVVTDGSLTCSPRPEIKSYMLESFDTSSIVGSEWSLERSIFANYVWDSQVKTNQEVLSECFDFDWKNGKVHRILKNEIIREQVKEIIKPYYKFM